MNHWKPYIAIVLVVYSLLPASKVQAVTLQVCPECVLNSVSAGLAASGIGDTLILRQGQYLEHNLIVDKSITILGIGNPVIDGQSLGEVMTITADGVTLSGVTFQNVGTSYLEDRAAIRIRRAKGFTLSENTIINAFFGIYLEKASQGSILSNTIQGFAKEEMSSGNAIHLWYCSEIDIEDNALSGHRDGIYLEFVDNSFIGCNSSVGHLRYGLHFMFSNDNIYTTNTFEHNGAGVAVMFSRRIQMLNNTFRENWGKAAYGLLLKEIFDGEITGNHFEENTMGVFVEGSNRIRFAHNRFLRNGWAIHISGGCVENRIVKNDFVANSFDLAIHSALGDNLIRENYWSDYTGYDLDKDGFGDVPYRPVKLFNYVVQKSPDAIILLRSFFVDLINYSEKVSPVFTPELVVDNSPLMKISMYYEDQH